MFKGGNFMIYFYFLIKIKEDTIIIKFKYLHY